MTAKEFLNQYLETKRTADSKLREITELNALATKTTATLSLDGGHTQNSKPDKLADICAKIVDAESEVHELIGDLLQIQRKVLLVIGKVKSAKYRELLEDRYIYGDKWNVIIDKMHYSRAQIFRLHGEALNQVEKMRLNET